MKINLNNIKFKESYSFLHEKVIGDYRDERHRVKFVKRRFNKNVPYVVYLYKQPINTKILDVLSHGKYNGEWFRGERPIRDYAQAFKFALEQWRDK